jgi:hyperosmotically inducible periplasmic protein
MNVTLPGASEATAPKPPRTPGLWASLTLALALVLGASGCAGNQYERSTGESVDDTATTSRVQKALSGDDTYRFPDVKVTTFKGTVQLSGFVNNEAQRAKATELARTVPGVKDVQNQITLK